MFSVPPLHADESADIHFIRNIYQSVFARDPQTVEYDRWLKFLASGGEKSRMFSLLKESNEFFHKFTPAGKVIQLNLTVYVQPEPRSLRAGSLMPGDRFKVVGRARDWFKVESDTVKGWVERSGVEIVYEMQKISQGSQVAQTTATESFEAALNRLRTARQELLALLLQDGRTDLFQFQPGQAIAGEKALQRYQDTLREFLVLRKVRDADNKLDFRAVELTLDDKDLFSYDVLRRLDEWVGRGAERVLVRTFRGGVSALPGGGEGGFTKVPFQRVYDRWREEAQRRSIILGVSLTFGDFGAAWSRENSELLARNGAGFSTGRYRRGVEFADPVSPEVRQESLRLLRESLEWPDQDLVLLDGLFPPDLENTSRDIRTRFVFNPRAVLEFEKEAGFPVAEMDVMRENVFIGWRRSVHREYYGVLHQTVIKARCSLAVVLPAQEEQETWPWTPWRELPADWLVVDRGRIEKFPMEGSTRVIVAYPCGVDGPDRDLDADILELQKKNPRIAGWLCREE